MHSNIVNWLSREGITPFAYQTEAWERIVGGKSGLINAPTGTGKTFAAWIGILNYFLSRQQVAGNSRQPNQAVKVIWITPLRALTNDISRALQRAADECQMNWQVAVRSGDISSTAKQKQLTKPPNAIVTTPESIHVLFTKKDHDTFLGNLEFVVIDEWHELLGSKRGTLTELAISYLKHLNPGLKVWGISATIGNLEEATRVLLSPLASGADLDSGADWSHSIVKSELQKQYKINTIYPEDILRYHWAGHMGLRLLPQVLQLIHQHRSSLIFCNTRGTAETWFRELTLAAPDLSSSIALHHGSLDMKIRQSVESALGSGQLRAVIATSSLDLGVDFRPVDNVVQIGSPKSVARFLQRAGRSGHAPGEVSKINFLPTSALELLEVAALKDAVRKAEIEPKQPLINPLDVLSQFLQTLAAGNGFRPDELYQIVRKTFAFSTLSVEEWTWSIDFIATGGKTLAGYSDYHKIKLGEDGKYYMADKRQRLRQALAVGAIISAPQIKIVSKNGRDLGTVEEEFLARIAPGENFWFAGEVYKLITIREQKAIVSKAKVSKGIISRWMGGRMELSGVLAQKVRQTLAESVVDKQQEDLQVLRPLLQIQQKRSQIPASNQLLCEVLNDDEGQHLFVYPFAGRKLNEGLAVLLAYRLSQISPNSFSIAMNDYGFELLSTRAFEVSPLQLTNLLSLENLRRDLESTSQVAELAGRQFREIAQICGLVFSGYPGERIKAKSLQISSSLLFTVFSKYDPYNLLYKQAFAEVFRNQLHVEAISAQLTQIQSQQVIIKPITKVSPLCLPILVDRFRLSMSTEELAEKFQDLLD